MSIALPGSVGLFSLLQEAFSHEGPMRPQLILSKSLHSFLDNFLWLANNVAARPTRIVDLISNTYPATVGTCDAVGTSMGKCPLHSQPQRLRHTAALETAVFALDLTPIDIIFQS